MGGYTYISNDDEVITLTFSTDTSAYASGDLIADTQELTRVFSDEKESVVVLKSITLLDKADQKMALWLVFLNANTSLGTENAAPSIADADAEDILAVIPIATSDYVDVGGAAVATKECAIALKAATATTSLWVGIVNSTGTPTYGASDLVGKFGFLR